MDTYETKAKEARLKVLEMIHRGKTSHVSSNFSVIDVATVLYENLKPEDEVVWSKGWAAATIYYFLAQQGKIPKEDLDKFPNAPYLALAETTVPGVLVNGGSCGHGLPIAVGMALAKKKAQEPGFVYCIMSDGELNEGTTWESAMLAAHHKLDNLVAVVDRNGWQAMGKTEDIVDIHVTRCFRAFGWDALYGNGHNYEHIVSSLVEKRFAQEDKPILCLFSTTKGKGVSFMENHLMYHYKHVDDETYQKALAELQ